MGLKMEIKFLKIKIESDWYFLLKIDLGKEIEIDIFLNGDHPPLSISPMAQQLRLLSRFGWLRLFR